MANWFKQLDSTLRGESTRAELLRGGRLEISATGLLLIVVGLGAIYGACMGTFAVVDGNAGGWRQMAASAVKVPLLFVLTLLVTLPSLYVFNALVGSRLSGANLVRLLVAAMAVLLSVLASFGTIVAFFSFTTTSYSFIVLLNVVVFTVAGVLGLRFLLRTLQRMSEPTIIAAPPPLEAAGEEIDDAMVAYEPGPLERRPPSLADGSVRNVFRIWVIVFALVGAQMSWVLRPFVGGSQEFALLRPKGSNFFQAVWSQIENLAGGNEKKR